MKLFRATSSTSPLLKSNAHSSSCIAATRAILFMVLLPIISVSSFQIRIHPLSSSYLSRASNIMRIPKTNHQPKISMNHCTRIPTTWRQHVKCRPPVGTSLMYKNKEFDDDVEESNAKGGIQTRRDVIDSVVATTDVIPNKNPQEGKPKIRRVVNSSSSSNKDGRKNVYVAKTLEEYREKMKEEYKDRLVVVRFYSNWCKSCKAVEPKYYRLARINPQVGFIDMPITKENQEELTKEFNLKSVPFGHIVHPEGGLVERLHMGKLYWDQFEDTFYSYVNGYCDVSTFYE